MHVVLQSPTHVQQAGTATTRVVPWVAWRVSGYDYCVLLTAESKEAWHRVAIVTIARNTATAVAAAMLSSMKVMSLA